MTRAWSFGPSSTPALPTRGDKISVNDLIVRASALALIQHPQAHRSYVDGKHVYHAHANIGIAVALDDGLIVPVVVDGRHQVGARDQPRDARPGGTRPRGQAEAARDRGRHLHRLQPGHVRRRQLRGDHQPARVGDPRGRRHRRRGRWWWTARSSCARSCARRCPATTAPARARTARSCCRRSSSCCSHRRCCSSTRPGQYTRAMQLTDVMSTSLVASPRRRGSAMPPAAWSSTTSARRSCSPTVDDLVGVITERDLLRCVSEGIDPSVPVSDRMTRHVLTASPHHRAGRGDGADGGRPLPPPAGRERRRQRDRPRLDARPDGLHVAAAATAAAWAPTTTSTRPR